MISETIQVQDVLAGNANEWAKVLKAEVDIQSLCDQAQEYEVGRSRWVMFADETGGYNVSVQREAKLFTSHMYRDLPLHTHLTSIVIDSAKTIPPFGLIGPEMLQDPNLADFPNLQTRREIKVTQQQELSSETKRIKKIEEVRTIKIHVPGAIIVFRQNIDSLGIIDSPRLEIQTQNSRTWIDSFDGKLTQFTAHTDIPVHDPTRWESTIPEERWVELMQTLSGHPFFKLVTDKWDQLITSDAKNN